MYKLFMFLPSSSRNWVRYSSFTVHKILIRQRRSTNSFHDSMVSGCNVFRAHSIPAMKGVKCLAAFICISSALTAIILNKGHNGGFLKCRPLRIPLTSPSTSSTSSTSTSPQALTTQVATLEPPALTHDLGWPTETPWPGRVKVSQSCTYEPSVSRRCRLWCLQPEWTKKKPGGKRLKCCSGDGHIVERDPAPYKMVVAYLYTGEEQMLRTHFRTWAKFSNDVLRQLRFLFAIETQERCCFKSLGT